MFALRVPLGCDMRLKTHGHRRISILIADQGGVFRLGLKKLFSLEDDLRVVAQAENPEHVLAAMRSFKPHVAFVQSELVAGELLEKVQGQSPSSRVVVMTSSSLEEETARFLETGAAGIIAKSVEPEMFVRCARKVFEGEVWAPKAQMARLSGVGRPGHRPTRPADTLTRREKTIISYLTQGWRNREIAQRLSITEQTVKNHLRSIYDKVGVSDRLELVLYAIHRRLDLPPIEPLERSA
jgi:DNA-binding NarL/FixJ family response regulator